MTYRRVIPRDLFNEGNLLKCLGALWCKLDDRVDFRAARVTHNDEPFDIRQREEDGSLYVENVRLVINGRLFGHRRPLNSRAPWPLYVWDEFYENAEEVAVFTDEGDLTDEFERLVGLQQACEHCGDTGIEPARMTHDAGDGEGEDQPCTVCA